MDNKQRMTAYAEQFGDLELNLHGVRLPRFDIDNKYKHQLQVSEDIDNFEFLKALCQQGLKNKKIKSKEYTSRLNYELETLEELGFTDYILLVWDVINFCNENDIAYNLGRGSAAGCYLYES